MHNPNISKIWLVIVKLCSFSIFEKESAKETLSHKSSGKQLKTYFREIFESYDEDRVYASDIKKVVQWYNLLHKHNMLDLEVAEAVSEEEE